VHKYRCLGSESISCEGITLGAIQPDEIETIRVWRNQQKEILRQNQDITISGQKSYFENFVWNYLDAPAPSQILLSIYEGNLLIGYGGLVHISWENFRAEISFLTDSLISEGSDEYRTVFISFLKAIESIARDKLGLHKLTLETYEIRDKHIAVIESAGFVREGTLIDHVLIDRQWLKSILHGKVFS
jgi:RimJ/RimL family protein N-acetyltransferase